MTEVEAAKRLRSTVKGKFTRAANNLDQAIDTGAPTKTIENRYGELKAAWNETQDKHDDFVKLLPSGELDEGWIEDLNKTFSKQPEIIKDKFPALLDLLLAFRERIEYKFNDLRSGSSEMGHTLLASRGIKEEKHVAGCTLTTMDTPSGDVKPSRTSLQQKRSSWSERMKLVSDVLNRAIQQSPASATSSVKKMDVACPIIRCCMRPTRQAYPSRMKRCLAQLRVGIQRSYCNSRS